MNFKGSVLAIYLAAAFTVIGCSSDNGTNATNSDNHPAENPVEVKPSILDTLVVQTSNDLPTCNDTRESRAFFVQGENLPYFCVNGTWRKTSDSTDFSITCKDGFLYASEKIFHDSTPVDYDTVKFQGLSHSSVRGVVRNGPFVFGTTITISELGETNFYRPTVSNDYYMNMTAGTSPNGPCTLTNDGYFLVDNVSTNSDYVEISATGFYKNVVTGRASDKPITLSAKTKIAGNPNKFGENVPGLIRDSVNINILTHLENPRIEQLSMNHIAFAEAKVQAEREIFNAFGIDTVQLYLQPFFMDGRTDKPIAEDMDLVGNSEYSAALLAISVMLQGNLNEDDMMNLVANIAEDIKGDGAWNDQNWKIKIADWIVGLDSAWGYNDIRNNVSAWGVGPVPNFEKYIRSFIPIAYGFEPCTIANAGQVTYVNQGQSVYFANDYEHADHSTVRFICDANSLQWRVATAMEKDTAGFGLGEYDREVREGRVSHDTYYIFDSGMWRVATPQEADGFTDIAEVYASLKPDDKAVFIIRHSERTDETGPKGHLTSNGIVYAQNLGKRLADVQKEDFYYGYSGYVRTQETCENIAIGKGQTNYNLDILGAMDGAWYVKNSASAENYINAEGGWIVYSRYAFLGDYSDAFYDLDTRSEQLLKDEILANIDKMKRVNVMCTHDYLVVPLLAYVTDGHANVRYYEKWRWVNYLAGVAMIISADGTIRYIPVKGLETGTM
jgi:broad specificity phosphatase PhoE